MEFDVECDALLLDTAALQRPLPDADERLRSLLERIPLPQVDTTDRVSSQLHEVFADEPSAPPRLEAAARKLAMSARTLHRRLAQEGTSYRQELESFRSRHATRLLADGQTLAETAYRLGFADVTAFCRAFRRWHGVPPRDLAPHPRTHLTELPPHARACDVHHPTMARWIRSAHAALARGTRERLRSGVAQQTLDSIIALELTLSRILGDVSG